MKRNIFDKVVDRIDLYRERIYNSSRIDRKSYFLCARTFAADDDYWLGVAAHIRRVAEDDSDNFFRDPEVILHLASENYRLGYELLERIRSHPKGSELLHKCNMSAWGSPYVFRRYPFASTTTLSHIANLLSLYDFFGGIPTTVLDFGGGYGGFARSLSQVVPSAVIRIVDIPDMLVVSRLYLEGTSNFGGFEFLDSLDSVNPGDPGIFNASFSFSEVPLARRGSIEEFIISRVSGAHIIFQPLFNGISNISYMRHFRERLESKGWEVEVGNYAWYGSNSVSLLRGRRVK